MKALMLVAATLAVGLAAPPGEPSASPADWARAARQEPSCPRGFVLFTASLAPRADKNRNNLICVRLLAPGRRDRSFPATDDRER